MNICAIIANVSGVRKEEWGMADTYIHTCMPKKYTTRTPTKSEHNSSYLVQVFFFSSGTSSSIP